MTSKYAYVSLLYNNNEYFTGSLILGLTLSKIRSPHDKVLMVTNDVPQEQRKVLSRFFIIKEVPYIYASTNIDPTSRFTGVFTKLNCLKYTEYDKVLMLDLDMFVLKNMDHLFNLPAPAAMARGPNWKTGQKYAKGFISIKDNEVKGGMNAGLMLLHPDMDEFDLILDEISKTLPYKIDNPEQDYLSYRYRDQWTQIDSRYNLQIKLKPINYTVHEIYNLHYSWILNPWELVLDNKDKVIAIFKKTGRDITYYILWVNHFRIMQRLLKYEGINIYSLFKNTNSLGNKINELYDSLFTDNNSSSEQTDE